MAETYTLNVAGLTRELTICKVNDHMDIAAFIMLGDTELTVAAAAELLKKCPEFDILLTAEAKGIPLAHEMSRQSGKPYVCARKGIKLYMKEPVVVEDQSITTAGKQKLVIDRKQNLDELASNLTNPKDKGRFWREVRRAHASDIKMIVLCEHGKGVKSIPDVVNWSSKYSPVTGRILQEKIYQCHISYGVEFLFCRKSETAAKIIELLEAGRNE